MFHVAHVDAPPISNTTRVFVENIDLIVSFFSHFSVYGSTHLLVTHESIRYPKHMESYSNVFQVILSHSKPL